MIDVNAMQIRDAERADVEVLAKLWFEGWQDAHVGLLPPEVAADRTLKSFRERLMDHLATVRTIGVPGRPLGFSLIKGSELNQFYVGKEARGTGVAAALMKDAEDRLRASGWAEAWLDCAIGNTRAARFYEKHLWRLRGVETTELTLRTGAFPLEVWRYVKRLD